MSRKSRRRRIAFWTIISSSGLIVVIGLFALTSNLVIVHSAKSYIVSSPAEAPLAQTAIILGARVYTNGNPSPMLADRLNVGIELYKTGKVKKLLLSGDHGRKEYDEVNAMLRYVIDHGIPEADVFTDHAGFNTYDTMYRARDVFLVESALIVTQDFHLSRAVYIARALGLEATGISADLQVYAYTRQVTLRDWLARVKAFFVLHISKPEPKFLGPTIPIDGDGRASRG